MCRTKYLLSDVPNAAHGSNRNGEAATYGSDVAPSIGLQQDDAIPLAQGTESAVSQALPLGVVALSSGRRQLPAVR